MKAYPPINHAVFLITYFDIKEKKMTLKNGQQGFSFIE